jgi:chorismate dehydratase
MAAAITVAAPPSLSARPLVMGLENRDDVRLVSASWEALAGLLGNGECDAALLPSIDYPRIIVNAERARASDRAVRPAPQRFVILPAPAVTSRGAVGALRLVGYVEKDKLRRVLLDPASPAGSALSQIIVQRQFGSRPHFVFSQETAKTPARRPDAELVTGDRALAGDIPQSEWDIDLGAEWHRMTYRPMVYAMWVARADGDLAQLTSLLSEAAAAGLEARDSMVAEAAARGKVKAEVLRRFLFDQTRYAFGPKEIEGLSAFLEMASQEGLAPEGVGLLIGE